MALKWMRACFDCDGCGKDFIVEIDTGQQYDSDDLMDIAENAVRGGDVVIMKAGRTEYNVGSALICGSSIQDDMKLCPDCTQIADNIDSDNPTADEIKHALEKKIA